MIFLEIATDLQNFPKNILYVFCVFFIYCTDAECVIRRMKFWQEPSPIMRLWIM